MSGAGVSSPLGAVPGRTTLVSAADRHPAALHTAAPAPGRATLTEWLPPARGTSLIDGWEPVWEAIDPGEYEHLAGGGDAKPRAPAPSAPKPAGAEQRSGDVRLAAWAGAGKTGAIFQHDTVESFVDGASADSVEIQTRWTLAEHEAYELGTTAVLEVRRELRIRLARGASVLATSRARAWLDADRLPNDVHAALHAPARLIKHEGSIFVADERGTHLMRSLPHLFAQAQSIAAHLGGEVAAMARDLGLWVLDELAHVLGRDVDWTASSSIGQAYQSGKSTGEIFQAMALGIASSFQEAIDHAARGDYSKLMDLGAELALDVVIAAATGGAAVPGAAARHAGAGGRIAAGAVTLTEAAASSLAARVRALLAKSRQALADAPAEARGAIHGAEDVFEGLLEGLTQAVRVADTVTGTKLAILDPGAIPRAIQRVRGARAIERAASAVTKLRGPVARAQGQRVVGQLQQLAGQPGMAPSIHALARRLAAGKDKARLVAALEHALGTWAPKLDPDTLARTLRRAANAVDPLQLLEDAGWVMRHEGLTAAARSGLLRHAVRRQDPLDLRWLRELTELPSDMLEFMALDPHTLWKPFMKASLKPSDCFPSSLKKVLGPRDYASVAAHLRGVVGELIFEVPGVELPAGLKIVGRQVDAKQRTIDFALQDARGKKAKLEVKAWNQKRWQKELALDPATINPKSPLGRMLEQLEAAKATGEPVYLAVSDAIGNDLQRLKRLLNDSKLGDVVVFTFPESTLKEAAVKLRSGLALAGGVALVTADQIAEVDDE